MSWSDININEVCLLAVDCVNKTAPTVDYETPYKMLRTTNVRKGFVDTDNCRFVTEEVYRKWTRRSIPQKGDVILTREAPLGDVGRIMNDDTIFLGQRLFHYRANPKKLHPAFLAYVLQSPIVQGRIKSKGFGATVQHVKVGECENLIIPFPPLPIQKKIGEILASYDDLIVNNQRRIQLLEESARLLYKEWFVHLRFPGHETTRIVDGVPEGWEKKQLGEALTLQRGFDLPTKKRKEGLVPIYASTGINGYHNQAKVKSPGIVTGRSGSLGQVMLVQKDFWPLNTTLWVKEFKKVTPIFAMHLLTEMNLEQYNGGAAVPTLNRNNIHRVNILIPCKKMITKYENIARVIYEQIEKLEQYNNTLAEARDLLLPRLMSGEVEV